MSTLLLQLIGPMQSWGTQSRFSIRDTGLEPSKSGVVGLLASALGRSRNAELADLAGLRLGIRVDREGRMEKDFHTTGGFRQNAPEAARVRVLKADGKYPPAKSSAVLSTRFYLADAAFLVGLEGSIEVLRPLHNALADPAWPLFLGRKAFPPSLPVWLPDGLRETQGLEEALQGYPRIAPARDQTEGPARVVLEDPTGEAVRVDQPISFAARRFAQRRVTTGWIPSAAIPERKER